MPGLLQALVAKTSTQLKKKTGTKFNIGKLNIYYFTQYELKMY